MDILNKLNIVYEDNHIIVVIKPQNIPTQEDDSGDLDMLSIVKNYIKEKYNKAGYVGLVHRLDRPTGGLLVFAKTSKAASRLSESIKNGDFSKKYFAVLIGIPKEKSKRLEHYLKKDERTNVVKIAPMSEVGAKKAELIYNVIDTYEEYIEVPVNFDKRKISQNEILTNEEPLATHKTEMKAINELSLVEVELLTGRSHQIRVQMASLKTPIFGDLKYGKQDGKKSDGIALWAHRLSFTHPTTKQKMFFESLPPTEQFPWNKFKFEKIKNN
jgi:23S rRNA pseudouridine1911/1915/1917 synthase